MKKFAMWMAALVATSALHAAPVGNPSAPQLIDEGFFMSCDTWINFRAGYEGDFVADARMKQQTEGHGRVDSYQQTTNAGTATINFVDRLDIFGVFGSSRTYGEWRYTDAIGEMFQVEMETLYHFRWGVGERGILFEWGNTSLGLGGRYESCNYDPEWLTIDGVNVDATGTSLKWYEWQVDLDISYRIDLLTPYIGLKYSYVNSTLNGFPVAISSSGEGKNHFRNRTPVGLFIGCSLSTGKYFMLNVEGRLIDEEAVTISGDIRF